MASFRRSAAFFLSLCILLLAQHGGQAQTGGPLKFFKNYFVTGGYLVAGVGLDKTGVGGLSSGVINMTAAPAGADALAAFLYWQVVSSTGSNAGAAGATFDGQLLSAPADFPDPGDGGPLAVVGDPAGTASCLLTGGGGGSRMYAYRADVLRFLPIVDGRRQINGAHTIALPDGGGSGSSPRALGASLVVVYRHPDLAAPLKSVVIYDGNFTKQPDQTMSQTISGFYDPASVPGQLTHIVGSGQAFLTERLTAPGVVVNNPFQSSLGNSWDTFTTATASLAPGTNSFVTSVEPAGILRDCMTWGAIVYQTQVNDTDGDGIVDRWETAGQSGTLTDPNGHLLPDVYAMGARTGQKDLLVQIDYMQTPGYTGGAADPPLSYGGVEQPAHTHLFDPAAVRMLGDAFWDAPERVHLHVDAGDSYPIYTDGDPLSAADDFAYAERYIIRGVNARGGHAIPETATVCPWPDCQFPEFPGTVGWKVGFQHFRDQLINSAPPPLDAAGNDPCDALSVAPGTDDGPGGQCERRFDRNRKDIFHYVLGAHFVGLPKSEFPCLDTDGNEVAATSHGLCAGASPEVDDPSLYNPAFHTPRTNSGVTDFPGADTLIALGGFADALGRPVGTPFMQGSTLMHEFGHTFDLTHAGLYSPFVPAEPNCKPNYLSVMNYLFQLRGLFNDDPFKAGVPLMDFSRQIFAGIDEFSPPDGFPLSVLSGSAARYRTGWYVPKGARIGSKATKHCDGSELLVLRDIAGNPILDGDGKPTYLEPPMIRVDSASVTAPIDWNLDPAAAITQDLNFDGIIAPLAPAVLGTLKAGSNDWIGLRLNQVGSRRNVLGFSLGLGRDGLGRDGLGRDGLGRDGLGRDGLGRDGLGTDGLGRDGLGRDGLGRDGLGRDGLGRDGLGRGGFDEQNEPDSITFEGSGFGPPTEVQVCVIGSGLGKCAAVSVPLHRNRVDWKPPTGGVVDQYLVYRMRTDDLTQTKVLVTGTVVTVIPAPGAPPEYFMVDPAELPNITFSYTVAAQFADDGDTETEVPVTESQPVNILAVNVAPVADPQSVAINEDLKLALPPLPITLVAHDVDSASLNYSYTAPAHGTLSGVAPNLTYTPHLNYFGNDSFTFKAVAGTFVSGAFSVAMSSDSNVATVSITVNPVNDVPSFTKGANQTVNQNAGAQTVAGWATSISPGPANSTPPADPPASESGQAVNFIVTNNNNSLFSTQPAVSPTGTLTYTPANNCTGVATVTVKIHDNGGTANSGVDTSATQTFTITVIVPKKLTEARPADLWFGLKNSADVGTKFDVKVDALKNDTVVASATITNVTLGSQASATYNASKAVLKEISLSAIAAPGIAFGTGDKLKLNVYVKVNSSSSHATAKATLWFNIPGAAGDTSSHLHATFGGSADKYFLVGTSSNPATFLLKKTDPGSGLTIQSVDVNADKTSFKLFGTWSVTLVP